MLLYKSFETLKLTPFEFQIVSYQSLFSKRKIDCQCNYKTIFFPLALTHSTVKLIARVEPSSDVAYCGATVETVACFSVKPPNQSIADTELNDASGRTKAQNVGVAVIKDNANGVVLDNVSPTNNDELDRFDSNVACQDRREEFPLGKTGTTMFM